MKRSKKASVYQRLSSLISILRGLLFLIILLSLSYFFIRSLQEPEAAIQKKFALNVEEDSAYTYIPEVDNGIIISDETVDADFIKDALEIDETKDNASMQIAALATNGIDTNLDDKAKNVHDINEKYYELYEEKLPEDIHIEKPKKKTEQKAVDFDKKPVIAIVIDDMGISLKRTRDIISIKAPITSSFLTYGTKLDAQVKSAVDAGHEVMIHVPMESKGNKDVAPDVLRVDMNEKDLKERLLNMLAKFKDAKGINNHMGSRFTEDKKQMGHVMEVLKEKQMFFLDSKTSSKSVGKEMAEKYNVESANRNVFLDNENDFNYIMGQLEKTEKVALKNGYAVAIGHPKTETFKALETWIPSLNEKGFTLVHLSDVVKMVNE